MTFNITSELKTLVSFNTLDMVTWVRNQSAWHLFIMQLGEYGSFTCNNLGIKMFEPDSNVSNNVLEIGGL